MRKIGLTFGLLAASAGAAAAGAIDRGTQSSAILFEPGNYVELTFGVIEPTVEGEASPLLGGGNSGNMYENYQTGSLQVKTEITEGLDFAIIIDKPFGAGTAYPTGTGYFAAGTTAELDSTGYTALLKYRFPSNVSLLGGIRYQTLSAAAFIPFVTAPPTFTPYSVNGEQSGGWGYVLGVAWEKPEIAARVSLTYNSAIDYELPTTENSILGPVNSTTDTTTPQSVNFEFQTGIAPNTLLFGGARWVDWTEFRISPPSYAVLTGGQSLVFYNGDTTTYTLGLGYKFNENWSGAISYMYDTPIDGYTLNLGPVNGYNSIGLAASYTQGAVKVTGAVRYYDLGDAETQVGSVAPGAVFSGNSAVGLGIRLGYMF